MLCERQILQVIWIAHILALDLQIRGGPLAILLRLNRVLYELLELLRRGSFYAFHQGGAALPIMGAATEPNRAIRVVLEHEGRADIPLRSPMMN